MSTDPTRLSTSELPRTLQRPPSSSDSRLALNAVAPELVDVPLPYIRHQIELESERMLVALRDLPLPPVSPRLGLGEFLVAQPALPSHDGEPPIHPTHVLAVSLPPESALAHTSAHASEQDAIVTLVPIHGIVFAAHCASQILRPVPQTPEHANGLILPVCPVSLPSVDALLFLRTYMYTKRVEALFAAPLFDDDDGDDDDGDDDDGDDDDGDNDDDDELAAHETADPTSESLSPSANTRALRLATRLARSPGVTPAHILERASRVLDVWKTAWCLSLNAEHDTKFWDAVDLAWEMVILALSLVKAEKSSCLLGGVHI